MLKDKEINLEVTDNAKLYILEKGTNLKYGARPLRRAIQRYIEDEISDIILKGDLLPYQYLKVDCLNNNLTFDIL